jgi:hypothetical protein
MFYLYTKVNDFLFTLIYYIYSFWLNMIVSCSVQCNEYILESQNVYVHVTRDISLGYHSKFRWILVVYCNIFSVHVRQDWKLENGYKSKVYVFWGTCGTRKSDVSKRKRMKFVKLDVGLRNSLLEVSSILFLLFSSWLTRLEKYWH